MRTFPLWLLLIAFCLTGCNPKDKVTKLQELAEKGDAQAAFDLGEMHATGEGIPQNNIEAVRWYKFAAEKKNPKAQCLLGTAYHKGIGITPDNQQAVFWLSQAAEQMDPLAHFQLGESHEDGWLGKKDINEAYKWYLLSASQGYPKAQKKVSVVENKITPEERQEGQQRAQLFRREWVKRETPALETLLKAAQAGDPEAQYKLGAMYSFGNNFPKNDIQSVEWLTRAAAQGNPEAQFELGLHLINGEGVPRNELEAYRWWSIATQQGHIRAQASLESLEKKLPTAQKLEAKQKANSFTPIKD